MSSLKQNLQLKQQQTLSLTTELKQAIELLQMSHTELESLIDETLLENPILEKASEDETSEIQNDDYLDSLPTKDEDVFDLDYDNLWQASETAQSHEAFDFISQRSTARKTLRDHIEAQIQLTFEDHDDKFMAVCLLDYLEPSGYFEGNLQKIAQDLGVNQEVLELILSELQTLDPVGVFAKNLSDCIRIQLQDRDLLDPELEHFITHLDLVEGYDFSKLKKLCDLDEDSFKEILELIRTCNPKPGAEFDLPIFDYIEPDILVKKNHEGIWIVETNDKVNHKIQLNENYLSMLKNVRDKKEKSYFSEKKKSANWLIKAVEQRSQTLVLTASEIVRTQCEFFEKGISALKPMRLDEIAKEIGVHESTVSRITTNKFLYSPRGFFELKYFFSSSIKKSYADDVSSKTVQFEIKQLVQNEPKEKPYSDDKLVKLLKVKGMTVARRTVTKYRVKMNIPNSVDRKKINLNKVLDD